MLIDDRVGSRELHKPLRTMGVPAEIRRLKYADASFHGHGPHGGVLVGVERKTVSEIVGESFGNSRRFARRQLPGLLARYDYVWLIVEGYTKIDPSSGMLMAGQWEAGFGGSRMLYENYKKQLLSITVRANLHIEHTSGIRETVHFLHALYGWWQKPYASHKSILHVDRQETETVILDERTWTRQCFAQFPGVGWERSKQVAKYFGSVEAGVLASNAEWMKALGIEKGQKRVATIKAFLKGQKVRQDAKGS